MHKWTVSLIVILVVVMALSVPVQAQDEDGLSEEQLVLIGRVTNARAMLDGYDSYAEEANRTLSQVIAVALLGQTQQFSSTVTWSRSGTMVRQDGVPAIQATISATSSETGLGPAGARDYGVEAEVRLIDDTLYVTASYVSPRPDMPKLPRGWVVVEDPDQVPYSILQLGDLMDPDRLVDDEDLFKAAASDVRLDGETAEDGTPLDVITVSFDRDGMAQVLRESPASEMDPATVDVLVTALSDDSHLVMVIKLDAGDNPYYVASDTLVRALGIDPEAMVPGQFGEGVTIDIVMETSNTEVYSQRNEPLPPVTVPEDVGR